MADAGEAYVLEPGREYGTGRLGLLDADVASFDRQMSEEFLEAGVRTHRVLGIIGLEEIIVNGEKLSLAEAERKGIIDSNFHPVVEIRTFGTKARIEDSLVARQSESKLLLEDAKKIISQELGSKEQLSNEEYAEWFAKTLGKNTALIHKKGWLHNYLTFHNITLDCRIVDLDSITELIHDGQRRLDIESGAGALLMLLDRLSLPTNKYMELFKKSYNAVFPPEARKSYFAKTAKRKQKERTK